MAFMKILLIVPRYSLSTKADFDYTLFPLGLAYISSVLKNAGHFVDCYNLNHCDGKIEDLIVAKLNSCKYDFVGLGNNALGYHITKIIMDLIRNHPSNPKIILGGPIITSEPELIFNDLKPDFGVIGEGEQTIVELLDAIKNNKPLSEVSGILYRDGKNLTKITQERTPVQDLDSLPLPDLQSFGFVEKLDKTHPNINFILNPFDYPRVYPLLGSRSCPYQCTFCYHDSRYRRRSMGNIMNEISLAVKRYKINILLIYDECFAVDKARMADFCKRINKLRKEIDWELKWACQMSPKDVDEEMLAMMYDAGCDSISYGFESYSPVVLKSMRKPITPQQIDNAFNWTLKHNVGIQANFIFGDVAETKETAKETLDYWKKNCKGQVGLGFIQPYPGSQIYKHCVEKGIIKDKLQFIKDDMNTRLWLNMTDKMTDKEIMELKNEILNSQSKYTDYVVPKKINKMSKNIYQMDVKCPFCNKEMTYKNFLLNNRFSFGIFIICRNCHMRYFIVSRLHRIAYEYYPYARIIRDMQLNFLNYIKKKAI